MHMLVSAGFEHEAYLWNPFQGNMISKLGGTKSSENSVRFLTLVRAGHSAPLVGVQVLADSFQVGRRVLRKHRISTVL
jgi:hypothetical protein